MGKPLKIKLSVPEPCHEDWDKMTPGEKGRHCSHCNKSVIDFSKFTDKELVEYISKHKETGCGKFNSTQLNRLIVANEPSHTPVFRRILFGTALAAGVASTVNGQSNNTAPTETQMPPPSSNVDWIRPTYKPTFDSTFKFFGTVTDSVTNQPVPFANVVIEVESKPIAGDMTDAYGNFQIKVNRDLMGKKLNILVTYFGYYDYRECCTFNNSFPPAINIEMRPNRNMDTIIEVKHITMGKFNMYSDTTKKGK